MKLGIKYWLLKIFIVFTPIVFVAQNPVKIDSLLTSWNDVSNTDSLRLTAIKAVVMDYFMNSKPDSSLVYLNQQILFAERVNRKADLANGVTMKGYYYFSSNMLEEALPLYKEGLRLYTELDSKAGMSSCINNLGIIYRRRGELDKAIEYYLQSSKLDLEIGDEEAYAKTNSNIGALFFIKEEFDVAKKYFEESLLLAKRHNNKRLEMTCLLNLGDICYELNELEKAEQNFIECVDISLALNDKSILAKSYTLLAAVYTKNNKTSTAIKYYTKAIEISQEIQNGIILHTALLGLSELALNDGDIIKSISCAKEAFELAKENSLIEGVAKSSDVLYNAYKIKGDSKLALSMLEINHVYIDSLRNHTNHDQLLKIQYQYEYERKMILDSISTAKANEIKNLKLKEQGRELEIKRKEKWYLSIGLFVLVLLVFYIYNRYNVIRGQKKEITHTHEKLAETTKELRDSIAYAELIQQAVLPTLKIEDLTKESFIYFNPKEKVSGDFYWIEQKDEYNGYAVADCTGHGIPGAFISMVGTILLNEIYNSKQIYVPNEILDELSRLVRLTLTNKNGHTMKDGMDISFAVLDSNTKMLYFSGANNPVWIVSKDSQKRINKETAIPLASENGRYLYEIKGDRQPVGDYGGRSQPFTLNSAHLEKGDAFYLFSDGFVDQFGGERGKKFKAKPFRSFLLSIYHQSMKEQDKSLSAKFESWRGDLEQIDDVTIMGVRV